MENRYKVVNLNYIISELGEEKSKQILSNFCCPKNKDVEDYIKLKSIEFSKQGLAGIHLVFSIIDDNLSLLGYFALSNKIISISSKSLSNTLKKRISKFATYDKETNTYILSSILIGQLGKNYNNGLNEYIKGDELLKIACDKVRETQMDVGGKIVYLECEENEYLMNFYKNNGFISFGKRKLDKDEIETLKGSYLIQFLRYL